MKIIEAGRPQKGWAKEFECTGSGNKGGGCGALLLVEIGDLFITESHARDETDTFITFECIACGVWTDIPSNDAPKNTHNFLPYKQWKLIKKA
jgi:hypothetical protein